MNTEIYPTRKMLGSRYCQRKTKTSINKGQGVWGPFKTSLQSVSKFQLLQYFWLQLTALQKALLRPPSHNVTLWDDVWLPFLLYFEFHSQSLSMLFPNCANSCTPDVRPKYRTVQNVFHYKIVTVGSNCPEETIKEQIIAEYHLERYLSDKRLYCSIMCGLGICLATRRQCHLQTFD